MKEQRAEGIRAMKERRAGEQRAKSREQRVESRK